MALDKNVFLRKFEAIVEMAPGSLNGDELLEAVQGWDSLAVLGIQALADSEFQTPFDVAALEHLKTVADIYTLLTS